MKILILILLIFSSLSDVFCQEFSSNEDNWTNNTYQIEVKWSDPFQAILNRMTRKPSPQQFFGLMGKRSSAKTQVTRKRQKFHYFVGLMGKRNLEEGSL